MENEKESLKKRVAPASATQTETEALKTDRSILEHKSFSEQAQKERILELQKTYRIIERPFTTEPKTRRIRKGHTIVIERCKEIMEHLWQRNFRTTATKKDIETSVFFCAGGDYRTIKKYLGFDVIARGKGGDSGRVVRRILGYLQRLRYIDQLGNGKYFLNHAIVPLDYHYEESFPPLPPSQELMNTTPSKQVLCVRSSEPSLPLCGDGEGAVAPTNYNKQQQHNTHTKSFQRLDTKVYPKLKLTPLVSKHASPMLPRRGNIDWKEKADSHG